MRTSIESIRVAELCPAGVLIYMTVSDARACGEEGHRLVGHMAHEILTPEAQRGIQQLMGSDDLATFTLHIQAWVAESTHLAKRR